jgi:hypothetical protein
VILISDVHVVSRPHIVTDFNTEVADDSTAATDQAPVADSDHWISNAFLAWHHAGRQRNIRTDQCVRTDVDVLLIEDCGRLPHDETSFAERTKPLAT